MNKFFKNKGNVIILIIVGLILLSSQWKKEAWIEHASCSFYSDYGCDLNNGDWMVYRDPGTSNCCATDIYANECNAEGYTEVYLDCGGGGACSCTDGGYDLMNKGRCLDQYGDYSPYDYCYSSTEVYEYYCSITEPGYVASDIVSCGSGYICSDGACKADTGCINDDDCSINSYCEGGNCLTCEQDGTLCSRDAQCCSDNCVGLYCEPSGTICKDTETGNGRTIAGTVTIGTNSWTDNCIDLFKVREYFCLDNDLATAQWDCSNYDEKCEGGKCVDNPQTCTGTCKQNLCSTYGGCSSGTGTCEIGTCCLGDCCTIGIQVSCTVDSRIGLKTCTSSGFSDCIVVTCTTDTDCTIGTYKKCLNGNCVQCIITPDCPSGYSCIGNICKVESNTCKDLGGECKTQSCTLLNMTSISGASDCTYCCKSDGSGDWIKYMWIIGGIMAFMLIIKVMGSTKK